MPLARQRSRLPNWRSYKSCHARAESCVAFLPSTTTTTTMDTPLSAPPPLTPPQVASIAHGPMFIGFAFNLILYGIMIMQTYVYFATYKQDNKWMKLFVILLFSLDTANTAFDFAYLYECFVAHYGDTAYLAKATWVFATDPALTGIIATLVQIFFGWRIKVLTGGYWLAGPVFVLAILGLVGALATAIEAAAIHPVFTEFQSFQSVVILWLASESVCDILITAILVLHLACKKKKTGFQQSDDIVDKIIRLTVQTGLITSVCALIDLVTFLAIPTGIHLIFNFPLAKLYACSLVSSMNSRGGGKGISTTSGGVGAGSNNTYNTARLGPHKLNEVRNSYMMQAKSEVPDSSDTIGSTRMAVEMTVNRHQFVDYPSKEVV
ncbi:hypothetical protein CYLTODRAFT_485909 [Cylindrobasidium torrendii FP15055 ss-10]|uniref:DUF6534 domain-containing protein n=1 Tax=Cylindrobasidium torrendii FP15055 ss-10 TaxID=1314674 RepID=A0A0D7BQW9_9AGAR|nr:hypothetical protein CYLTODRAFT_485909 [Cylindrobasidium torrendii FP15055 ss-10]